MAACGELPSSRRRDSEEMAADALDRFQDGGGLTWPRGSSSASIDAPPEADVTQPGSPYSRSIGLAGLVRWLIVVVGAIAVIAAFAAGFYALAIAGVVFLAAAAALGYRAGRTR